MRVKGATIQQILLGLALLAGLCWNLAHASEINGLRVTTGATGTRAEIALDRAADYHLITLANPDRFVVDLPDSHFGTGVRLPTGAGVVKAVRDGKPVPGTVRIVFDLTGPVAPIKPHLEAGPGGQYLVLEWPGDGGAGSVPAVATAAAPLADAPSASASMTPAAPGDADAATAARNQTAASADATARLIANLQTQAAATHSAATPNPSPASPPQLQPTGNRTLSQAVPTSPPSSAPLAASASGTIASGVPTRVATGVPTTVATGVPTTIARGAPVAVTPPSSSLAQSAAPVRSIRDLGRAGLRPLIVAIDAGHGGQDPGAHGSGGTLEKNVTLQIARELARQVNATPGLKAYLTRDSDYFIPLVQRYQKARAAKADLFVSIHADASVASTATGSSVFVLSQRGATSQAARWLANQENAADLVGGVRLQDKDNTLASVLLDLSQSATMKASEDTARYVLQGLRNIGRTHKSDIERANFVVLRSPDVPSMLVETGFITNAGEERNLRDPDYQRQLAHAVLNGVNAYFTRQPPPGTLYAARADNGGGSGGSP